MANLIKRLPDSLAELYEFRELLAAENPEFDLLDDLLYQWTQNLFPKTADARGIAFFEDLLDITPLPRDSLDTRRFRVLAKLNSRLPYTEIQLRKMLAAVCGWDGFRLKVEDLVVLVSLTEGNGDKIQAIYEMLLEVIPMNLLIEIHQLLETRLHLRSAAATEMGTSLTLFPLQAKELATAWRGLTAAAARWGVSLTLFPRQMDELRTVLGIHSGASAARTGATVRILPRGPRENTQEG